jgi:hypothetical protein
MLNLLIYSIPQTINPIPQNPHLQPNPKLTLIISQKSTIASKSPLTILNSNNSPTKEAQTSKTVLSPIKTPRSSTALTPIHKNTLIHPIRTMKTMNKTYQAQKIYRNKYLHVSLAARHRLKLNIRVNHLLLNIKVNHHFA